jgi:hypothetical protein
LRFDRSRSDIHRCPYWQQSISEALVGRIGWQNAPSIPNNAGRRGFYETANYRKGHAFLESEYFLNGGFPVN